MRRLIVRWLWRTSYGQWLWRYWDERRIDVWSLRHGGRLLVPWTQFALEFIIGARCGNCHKRQAAMQNHWCQFCDTPRCASDGHKEGWCQLRDWWRDTTKAVIYDHR